MKEAHQLAEHFFRHQAGRLVATLTRILGPRHLDLVEDVVQAAFVQALRSWATRGVPSDPAGWLFCVAKNAALDTLRRERRWTATLSTKLASEFSEPDAQAADDLTRIDRLPELEDDALRMLCLCCHPALSLESQIAVALKMACGFSTHEIARALLSSAATIQRRISRAKESLRNESMIELDAETFRDQLPAVLHVVYLIFNEGYNSSGVESMIRQDLCEEALRLGGAITRNATGNVPRARALMALMSFQAARFDARLQASGDLVLLPDQDRSRWNRARIHQGVRWLAAAAEGNELSAYHLEAGIAAEHSLAQDFAATNWDRITRLYDLLVRIQPTPVHRLNRAIAIAYAHGPQSGLNALATINWSEVPATYYLFDAALGELHRRAGHFEQAEKHLRRAIALSPSPPEQRLLQARLVAARNSDAAG